MVLKRAVDFSRFGGNIDQAKIACWKAQGITRVMVQYNTTGHFEQALTELTAAGGIEIFGYVGRIIDGIAGPGVPDRVFATRDAIARAAGRCRVLVQDIEDGSFIGTAFNAQQVHDCLAVQAQANVRAMMYTARGYWTSAAGNTTQFSHLQLIDARFLPEGSPWPSSTDGAGTSRPFVAYGGWSKCHQWQWHNTTTLCNHSVDLNVYDARPFFIHEGEQ
jgi:hypothetical protein